MLSFGLAPCLLNIMILFLGESLDVGREENREEERSPAGVRSCSLLRGSVPALRSEDAMRIEAGRVRDRREGSGVRLLSVRMLAAVLSAEPVVGRM